MSNNYSQAMRQKFLKDLQYIDYNDGDSDHGSEQSEDYYQFERKRMEIAVSALKDKDKSKNAILEQLKKNTVSEIQYINECSDEITDLHNITRNNKQNILQQQVIKQIKHRVFNQSMLNQLKLTDQQLQKAKQKQEQAVLLINQKLRKEHKINNIDGRDGDRALAQRIDKAKMETQLARMNRQENLSMKYEMETLSKFFSQRFYTPVFGIPENRPTLILPTLSYAPKTTITNLKPLPNTENNILARNAPQLALRALNRAKKIRLVACSKSEVAVKIRKINPEEEQQEIKNSRPISKKQYILNELQHSIENYTTFINTVIPEIDRYSRSYRPKFINYFPSSNQQNFNIDQEISQSKSIADCLKVEKVEEIKDIKLTFEKIGSLDGIDRFINVENISLQFNVIGNLSCIQNCSRVIQLDLSHNKIKSISSIKQLKYLKVLNIEYNLIQSIELKGGSLEILLGGNNRIQQIIDLSANVYLKRLDMKNNRLHRIGGLNGLYFLQQIDISSNFIQDLLGISSCILLRSLDVSVNRLKYLHERFTYIFLNRLVLSDNLIEGLPEMFLPSLEELYLDRNKIENQGQRMVYLPRLKVLNLDENKLSGFCAVWAMVRYSYNLQTIKYDRNIYFMDIRQKVKQLYQHILYLNMNRLKLLNQSPFDIGMKKYYEGVYNSYLSSSVNIFKDEGYHLEQIHNKIKFMIAQNWFMTKLEDRRLRFSERDGFITQKSVRKMKELVQIADFLGRRDKVIVLHATKSLFYEHDKYQYGMRAALHKIKGMIIRRRYYLNKKKQFYMKNKNHIADIFHYLQNLMRKLQIHRLIQIFHLPLERMGAEQAAILIQKHWRGFKLRRRYRLIRDKLRKKRNEEVQIEEIDLKQYNFDEMVMPEFNYEIPEEMDLFIIKPEILEILNKEQDKREKKIESGGAKVEMSHRESGGDRGGSNQQLKKVNNFIVEDNASQKVNKQEEEILSIMKKHGIKREDAMKVYKNNLVKKKNREKEEYKNMTAGQRYECFKRKANH